MSGDVRDMQCSSGLVSGVTSEEIQQVRVLSVAMVPRAELLEILRMIGIANPIAVRIKVAA